MVLTPKVFLIVCPLLFLAGFVDSIGGGGGLISLPAFLIAGLPPHMAIGTNKMSSTFGTALTTVRFIKNRLVNFKLAVPSVIAAMIGSFAGAKLSLLLTEKMIRGLMIVILPVAAFFVLNRHLFGDGGDEEVRLDRRTYLTASLSALLIGLYDGFYGPGTGTFLIIAFTVFAKLSIAVSNAQAKVINLTTNITALTVFALSGQVLFLLGIACAACNMLGNYVGSGLVMTKGSKIVRPVILGVLFLLLLKILGVY